MFANVWTDIGVRFDVLFQHAWLLAADAALPAYVLSPAATSHVNILLIGLIPMRNRQVRDQREQL